MNKQQTLDHLKIREDLPERRGNMEKYKILRRVTGTEDFPLTGPMVLEGGVWQVWSEEEESPMVTLLMYVDIQERDGDPPTRWRITLEGRTLAEVDATRMTPEERKSIPAEVVEAGRRIAFGPIV